MRVDTMRRSSRRQATTLGRSRLRDIVVRIAAIIARDVSPGQWRAGVVSARIGLVLPFSETTKG